MSLCSPFAEAGSKTLEAHNQNGSRGACVCVCTPNQVQAGQDEFIPKSGLTETIDIEVRSPN